MLHLLNRVCSLLLHVISITFCIVPGTLWAPQIIHPLPATQEKTLHMDIRDGQHQNHIDYILSSQRWRSSIQSAKTRLGADCGSDHKQLIVKFRLKLKKVGKTTRPFRYDLNQIPYDYKVEARNRFKGLDLIECLMN